MTCVKEKGNSSFYFSVPIKSSGLEQIDELMRPIEPPTPEGRAQQMLLAQDKVLFEARRGDWANNVLIDNNGNGYQVQVTLSIQTMSAGKELAHKKP